MWGVRFGVWGLGFGVWCLGFRMGGGQPVIECFGFRVWGDCLGLRIWRLGFRVYIGFRRLGCWVMVTRTLSILCEIALRRVSVTRSVWQVRRRPKLPTPGAFRD